MGSSRLRLAFLGAAAVWLIAAPAMAGPPYLTDDPQPTDTGHWEIYNFVMASSAPEGLNGETGVDLNYGGAKDLQLTAVLPLGFDNPRGVSANGLRGADGVIELAAKYKVVHADDQDWTPDISVFPRVFVPTDSRFGPPHANLFLPVWAEKDFGPWQVFGGGGYQFNPGRGQRDFWQGGVAVNRTLSERVSLGVELYNQGDDTTAGGGFTAVNFGATYKLIEHWSLLVSAGPARESGGAAGSVFYISLKADY